MTAIVCIVILIGAGLALYGAPRRDSDKGQMSLALGIILIFVAIIKAVEWGL